MAANVVVGGNRIEWGKAVVAGIISIVVFAAMIMAFAWAVRGVSPWRPLDVFGAIVLGQPASADAVLHTVSTTVAGALLLLALGVLSGIVVALLVHRTSPALAIVIGAAFGLAMYYVDMHGFARIFDVLAMLRGRSTLAAYAIQGALAAGLYKALTRPLVGRSPEYAQHDLRRLREVPLH